MSRKPTQTQHAALVLMGQGWVLRLERRYLWDNSSKIRTWVELFPPPDLRREQPDLDTVKIGLRTVNSLLDKGLVEAVRATSSRRGQEGYIYLGLTPHGSGWAQTPLVGG